MLIVRTCARTVFNEARSFWEVRETPEKRPLPPRRDTVPETPGSRVTEDHAKIIILVQSNTLTLTRKNAVLWCSWPCSAEVQCAAYESEVMVVVADEMGSAGMLCLAPARAAAGKAYLLDSNLE